MNQTETINKVLKQIDQSQLANSTNDVDMRKLSEDMKPSEFTKGLDKVADSDRLYNDSEMSPHYAETLRFAKSHEISDSEMRANKGNKTK